MARQRINLVPDDEKEEFVLTQQILNEEINTDNFNQLPIEQQEKVKQILFKMAANKIEPNMGASVLEFIVFAFMRIAYKKIKGLSLTSEDKKIEAFLERIFNLHEITNDDIYMKDWLFNYLEYAETKAVKILENRQEHIKRKKKIVGNI